MIFAMMRRLCVIGLWLVDISCHPPRSHEHVMLIYLDEDKQFVALAALHVFRRMLDVDRSIQTDLKSHLVAPSITSDDLDPTATSSSPQCQRITLSIDGFRYAHEAIFGERPPLSAVSACWALAGVPSQVTETAFIRHVSAFAEGLSKPPGTVIPPEAEKRLLCPLSYYRGATTHDVFAAAERRQNEHYLEFISRQSKATPAAAAASKENPPPRFPHSVIVPGDPADEVTPYPGQLHRDTFVPAAVSTTTAFAKSTGCIPLSVGAVSRAFQTLDNDSDGIVTLGDIDEITRRGLARSKTMWE